MGLPISMVAAFHKVGSDLAETTLRGTELERPQKIVGLFKVLPNRVDLVNEILHADDVELAQLILNDGVVSYSNTHSVHFAIATLVDQFPHTL